MKKLILFFMCLILMSTIALAELQLSSINFGDDRQERAETVSVTVTITNNGPENLTDFNVTSTASSKYDVGITDIPSALNTGESAELTINAYVPLDFDAVDEDGNKKSFKIGTLTVKGDDDGNQISANKDMMMEAESHLTIDEVNLVVNDDDDQDVNDDGDSFDDLEIKPNDDLRFEVSLENSFDNDGRCTEDGQDCDFNNAEADIYIDGNDWYEDDTIDFDDIDSDELKTESIDFEVDKDADGDYDVEIMVVERDDNGARHGAYWKLDFEVDKKKHDIDITDASFYPETLECDYSTRLTVDFRNVGKNDEEDAVIDVESNELDIFESENRIVIDENDKDDLTFTVTVPEDAIPGTYYVDVTSYYDNDEKSDVDVAKLIIKECKKDNEDEKETTPEKNPEEKENNSLTDLGSETGSTHVNIIPPITGNVVRDGGETGEFTQSKGYIIMLIGGIFIVLLLIILESTILLRQ